MALPDPAPLHAEIRILDTLEFVCARAGAGAASHRAGHDLSSKPHRCSGDAELRAGKKSSVRYDRWSLLSDFVCGRNVHLLFDCGFPWSWFDLSRPGEQRLASVFKPAILSRRICA